MFSKCLRGIQFTIKETRRPCCFPRLHTTQPNICTNVHRCAQPFTFRDEVELQKHLNTCLRKVIIRTLEHFLNIFEMFSRVFSSAPLSTVFHSAPIAKRCTSHVIITFGAKLHQHPVVVEDQNCSVLEQKP